MSDSFPAAHAALPLAVAAPSRGSAGRCAVLWALPTVVALACTGPRTPAKPAKEAAPDTEPEVAAPEVVAPAQTVKVGRAAAQTLRCLPFQADAHACSHALNPSWARCAGSDVDVANSCRCRPLPRRFTALLTWRRPRQRLCPLPSLSTARPSTAMATAAPTDTARWGWLMGSFSEQLAWTLLKAPACHLLQAA